MLHFLNLKGLITLIWKLKLQEPVDMTGGLVAKSWASKTLVLDLNFLDFH